MPRNLHIKAPLRATRVPAVLRTHLRKEVNPKSLIKRATPRLWNAKRRIKQSRGLSYDEFKAYREKPTSYDWRTKTVQIYGKDVKEDRVSPDVAAFLDANPNLLQSEKASLLRFPSRYFSRPYRVPVEQRKQVYLPDFSVVFIRTPRLGPYYAHFQVPLWFNKLDMKSYLTNVYDVDTVHIRSYVTHGKKSHREARRAGSSGPAYRMKSKKRMTVQLVEPFEWPKEVEDFSEYVLPSHLSRPLCLPVSILTYPQMGANRILAFPQSPSRPQQAPVQALGQRQPRSAPSNIDSKASSRIIEGEDSMEANVDADTF